MELSEKKRERFQSMVQEIETIISAALDLEKKYEKQLQKVHPKFQLSAINLIHYRAFREHDSRSLQKKLGQLGLSRMAKNQNNVMASLRNNLFILNAYLGNFSPKKRSGLSVKKSNRLQKTNSKSLLGYRSKGRRTRIMVTLPSEAAENYQLVEDMVAGGMNCARINCAHDDQAAWLKMIDNVRKASNKLQKKCKIAMDLGGPKIRTGQFAPGPKVIKLRPEKDIRGKIIHPLKIWLGPFTNDSVSCPYVPISQADFEKTAAGNVLFFKDARGKKRSLNIVEKQEKGCFVLCERTTYLETGMKLFLQNDRKGNFVTVAELPEIEQPILLKGGAILRIDRQSILGESAKFDENGNLKTEAHIFCTAPEILDQVKEGEPILFDDGKIRGIIKDVYPDELIVEILQTSTKGGKLRADKGINLPSSDLKISGLTAKDRKDLSFVVKHADVVNMSFVNNPKDVNDLLEALKKENAQDGFGVILKIETQSGFNNLFEILLKAMQIYPLGVMIARGDLAIETGWLNIGRIQDEILSICQAAHITDVWATQVLESLAKNGIPSRAEITDVIKAQQADCVMLNKGPYILESIRFLDKILKQMEPYREKNMPFSPRIVPADPVNKING